MKLITGGEKFEVMIIEGAWKSPGRERLKKIAQEMSQPEGARKMEKIGIEYIIINRAEGLTTEVRAEHKVENMDQANEVLQKMARTAPKTGYNKTDFLITWKDGLDYKGTYALKHNSIEAPNLKKHVLRNLKTMLKMATENNDEYKRILQEREF